MLADVGCTHPRTARPGDRHEPNETYVEPARFLSDWRPVPADPLQSDPPRVDLADPSPVDARQVVRDTAAGVLPAAALEDLVIAVSEVVTNAQRHGRPPARFRVWAGETRVVVTVTDHGDGPTDPFAGLLAARTSGSGGLGLWITHQACDHVVFSRDESGFTVRMTAGLLEASEPVSRSPSG
jgi:anti-sigma regulatory factor (Ser/Thr protein kinase)